MPSLRHSASFIGVASLLCAWPALLAASEPDIGVFTSVEGKVSVQHAQSPDLHPAKLQDTVLFRDLIETQKESRTKALLNDDSILTIGEHSRVEITEHLYDPKRSLRSVVVNLVQGQVRALVGKVFEGSGSKFEVHTPTAVAAARGTYFVVWHVNGTSGIANIGNHGQVGFASGGQTVTVSPGSFSIAPPGGGPPAPPTPLTGSNVPAQVTAAVQGTAVADAPESESPSRAAAASGGTAPLQSPPASANVPSATSGVSSSTTSTASPTGITPPAVTSGAVPGDSGSGEESSGSGDTGGGGGTGGSGSKPPNRGLHLGQLGLQPGFGNPTPGNYITPPAVTSGAAGRGPSFTPPGHGGTPPGHGGGPPGGGPPGGGPPGGGPPGGGPPGGGPPGGNGPKK